MIKKAVIPIAGYGTRMLPATLAIPKTMLNVVDKPVIEYIIEEVRDSGITDVLLITNLGSDIIEKQFSRNYELENFLRNDAIVEQLKNRFNDINIYLKKASTNSSLAESILDAKNFVGNEPFLLVLGDEIFSVPCSKILIEKYNEFQKNIIAVKQVEKKSIHNYGIVEVEQYEDKLSVVKKMFEKPSLNETNSNIAIIGRYVLNPSIFGEIQKQLDDSRKIDFTKALQSLNETKYAFEIDFERYDCGSKFGLLIANIEMGLNNSEIADKLREYLKELKCKL